jgi:hypothetical protein
MINQKIDQKEEDLAAMMAGIGFCYFISVANVLMAGLGFYVLGQCL